MLTRPLHIVEDSRREATASICKVSPSRTVQGTTSLLESSAPIWILGICYSDATVDDATVDAEEGSTLKQEVWAGFNSNIISCGAG